MIKPLIVVLAAIVIIAAAIAYGTGLIRNPSPSTPPAKTSIFQFTMKDIDGKDVDLSTYRGRAIMIVNVASKCGYTSQYAGLQSLYEEYKDRGFVILGFPANNFMGQEPGTEEEIKDFCSTNYNVKFPMFAKVSVRGEDQHPLNTLLTNPISNPEHGGEITWNFNKFLIGLDGTVKARFGTKEEPRSEAVIAAIENALPAK